MNRAAMLVVITACVPGLLPGQASLNLGGPPPGTASYNIYESWNVASTTGAISQYTLLQRDPNNAGAVVPVLASSTLSSDVLGIAGGNLAAGGGRSQ